MRMCCTVTSNALHKFKTPSSRAAVVRLLGYAMRGSAPFGLVKGEFTGNMYNCGLYGSARGFICNSARRARWYSHSMSGN